MFYHDIKKTISASQFGYWHDSKSAFRNSYFDNKFVETEAMKEGTKYHALIEGGVIPVELDFAQREYDFDEVVDGIPVFTKMDAFEYDEDTKTFKFVDYKTSVQPKCHWTQKKAELDSKQKFYAWIGRKFYGAEHVEGAIEWIHIDPETHEVLDRKVFNVEYDLDRLDGVTAMLEQQIIDVNKEYEEWLGKTDEFVSDAIVEEMLQNKLEIDALTAKNKALAATVMSGLQAGNERTKKVDIGSVFITQRKSYTIPKTTPIKIGEHEFTIEEAKEAISIAEGMYKEENEPDNVTESLTVKPKK